jgi:hypothetical protein
MVSSPWFRSRSASAIVPVPENSSDAYHKEIYTVLFDPPSFRMVYSIVRHLWKLSKSKKFLPLPPLPPSQQEHSTDISEFCIDSIPDAEGEISASSTSVLESISSHHHYNFSFGNFHSEIVQIKSIKSVKQEIKGYTVKIGKIECFTNKFKQEHDSGSALSLSDSTSEIKEEFMKSPNASNSSLSTFALEPVSSVFVMVPTIKIGEIICSIVSETSQFNAKKVEEFAIDQKLALVCKDLFPIFDQLFFLQSGVFCFRNSNCISKNELCDMDYVLIVETVFDPGGVTELISDTRFSGTITLTFSMSLIFRLVIVFATEFSGEFAVIVFDPGGNQLTSVFGELLI